MTLQKKTKINKVDGYAVLYINNGKLYSIEVDEKEQAELVNDALEDFAKKTISLNDLKNILSSYMGKQPIEYTKQNVIQKGNTKYVHSKFYSGHIKVYNKQPIIISGDVLSVFEQGGTINIAPAGGIYNDPGSFGLQYYMEKGGKIDPNKIYTRKDALQHIKNFYEQSKKDVSNQIVQSFASPSISLFLINGKPLNKNLTHGSVSSNHITDLGRKMWYYMTTEKPDKTDNANFKNFVINDFILNKKNYYFSRFSNNPYTYWEGEGVSKKELDEFIEQIKSVTKPDDITFKIADTYVDRYEKGGLVMVPKLKEAIDYLVKNGQLYSLLFDKYEGNFRYTEYNDSALLSAQLPLSGNIVFVLVSYFPENDDFYEHYSMRLFSDSHTSEINTFEGFITIMADNLPDLLKIVEGELSELDAKLTDAEPMFNESHIFTKLKKGDSVTIHSPGSMYNHKSGTIEQAMPDGETYEVKIKYRVGAEYIKFKRDELVAEGESAINIEPIPKSLFADGGNIYTPFENSILKYWEQYGGSPLSTYKELNKLKKTKSAYVGTFGLINYTTLIESLSFADLQKIAKIKEEYNLPELGLFAKGGKLPDGERDYLVWVDFQKEPLKAHANMVSAGSYFMYLSEANTIAKNTKKNLPGTKITITKGEVLNEEDFKKKKVKEFADGGDVESKELNKSVKRYSKYQDFINDNIGQTKCVFEWGNTEISHANGISKEELENLFKKILYHEFIDNDFYNNYASHSVKKEYDNIFNIFYQELVDNPKVFSYFWSKNVKKCTNSRCLYCIKNIHYDGLSESHADSLVRTYKNQLSNEFKTQYSRYKKDYTNQEFKYARGGNLRVINVSPIKFVEQNAQKLLDYYMPGVEHNEVFEPTKRGAPAGTYYIYKEKVGDGSHEAIIDIVLGEAYEQASKDLEDNYNSYAKFAEDISDAPGAHFDVQILSNDEYKTISIVFTDVK